MREREDRMGTIGDEGLVLEFDSFVHDLFDHRRRSKDVRSTLVRLISVAIVLLVAVRFTRSKPIARVGSFVFVSMVLVMAFLIARMRHYKTLMCVSYAVEVLLILSTVYCVGRS